MKKLLLSFILTTIGAFSMKAQIITTIAGGGYSGLGDGGLASSCELNAPSGISMDAAGNLYIVDSGNRLRKIDKTTGIINTVAGGGTVTNTGNGIPATSTSLDGVRGIAFDASGNIYMAESQGHIIDKLMVNTGMLTLAAGSVVANGIPNSNSGYNGDGIPAANSARLNFPFGIAVDASGNLYIADTYNNRIRKVDVSTGIISTIAGTGAYGYNGDGIPATSAKLSSPSGIALDAYGNIYIADSDNNRLRRIDVTTGFISTIAGNGGMGYSGDGGPASASQLRPAVIALDGANNIYISDLQNKRVRKIDAASHIITTIAGTGDFGYNGDGIPAITAQLGGVNGIYVDAAGNVYLADSGNNRVRMINAPTNVPVINPNENSVNIYPNPFSTEARIAFSKEQQHTSIILMDMFGRNVRGADFTGNVFVLERAYLKSGLYFLSIREENGAEIKNKLVIE